MSEPMSVKERIALLKKQQDASTTPVKEPPKPEGKKSAVAERLAAMKAGNKAEESPSKAPLPLPTETAGKSSIADRIAAMKAQEVGTSNEPSSSDGAIGGKTIQGAQRRSSIADRIAALKTTSPVKEDPPIPKPGEGENRSAVKRLSIGLNIPMGAFNPMAPRPPMMMPRKQDDTEDSLETHTRSSIDSSNDEDRTLKHASLTRAAIPSERRRKVTASTRLTQTDMEELGIGRGSLTERDSIELPDRIEE